MESVVAPDGVRGLKVTSVAPGTPADKAGLQGGDVIRSINGLRTEEPGSLGRVIASTAPNTILIMTVRKVGDGKEHQVLVQLPTAPLNTSRRPYLPPVQNEPPPPSQ